MNENPTKQLERRIAEACNGSTNNVLTVCCWDVGTPRKGAWVIKTFLPKPNETPKEYRSREQAARNYAEKLQTDYNAKARPYNALEAALLIVAPECIDKELDYFVANAQGIRW